MVFPHEHVLLRFSGHFGGGTPPGLDQWSVGIRMGLTTSAPAYDAAKLQTLVNSAQTAANTFHQTTTVGTGITTYLNQVSGAQIGVLGRYSPTTQQTILSAVTTTPGVGAVVQPWTSALVFSLRTAAPRGYASNGRVYWPATAAPIDGNTGRVTSACILARCNAFKTFVNALNTAGNIYSPGMAVVVASAVGGGAIRPVTKVRSDYRMDSIERRENGQPAAWLEVPIP